MTPVSCHRALRISSSQLVIVSRDGDPTAFLDPSAALDSFPMKEQNRSGKTKATRQIQPRCEEGTSLCLFNQNGSFNRSKYTAHEVPEHQDVVTAVNSFVQTVKTFL